MGECILHGNSGGSGLNFRVLGGTSAPALPKENDIWVNTNTEVTSWDFSTTEPCRRSANRNLLTYPYYHTTMTDNGITFTDNGDGTVKANGTATAQARFRPFHNKVASGMIWLDPGTYTASGCPKGGSRTTYFWEVYDNDAQKGLAYDIGDGATFTLTHGTHVRGSFIVNSGNKLTNAVFKPQIEKGSSPTSFVKGDATGQVWITTGASSPVAFDALKKNGVMVYPLSAKQYIGGTRVVKEASIYQSGEWVQFSSYWDGYYFKDGDQYEEITGGWTSEGWDNSATATIGETLIVRANGNATGRMGIANPVDLTNVNTLWYDSPNGNNGASNSGYLCIANAKTYGSGNRVASVTIRKAGTGSIDVSNLSGEHYLYLYAMGSSGATAYADIRAIWGE